MGQTTEEAEMNVFDTPHDWHAREQTRLWRILTDLAVLVEEADERALPKFTEYCHRLANHTGIDWQTVYACALKNARDFLATYYRGPVEGHRVTEGDVLCYVPLKAHEAELSWR